MLKTIGISPKVKLPAIALAVVGAAVALVGYLIGDTPTLTAGVGIVGASGLGFGVGYSAAPGQVKSPDVDLGALLDQMDSVQARQAVESVLAWVADLGKISAPLLSLSAAGTGTGGAKALGTLKKAAEDATVGSGQIDQGPQA